MDPKYAEADWHRYLGVITFCLEWEHLCKLKTHSWQTFQDTLGPFIDLWDSSYYVRILMIKSSTYGLLTPIINKSQGLG